MAKQRGYFTWAGIALLFAAMLGGLLWLEQDEVDTFRAEGLLTNARVTDKNETRDIANDTSTHTLDLAYMNREDTAHGGVAVDLLNGEFELGEIAVGDFQRARAEVRGGSYDRINVGDRVAIYYLPDRPQKAMLAAEVDGYNAGFLGAAAALLLGATAVLAVLGVVQRLRPRPVPAASGREATGG